MRLRLALAGAVIGVLCSAPGALAAPTITTGDAYSNGSGGTASYLYAKFTTDNCAAAVAYQIGTQPLDQGGARVWNSISNTASSPNGKTTDTTSVGGFTPGTLYYYRAVLTTHNCPTAGESAAGAQRCMLKQDSFNELESTTCPGAPGPSPTPGPTVSPTPVPTVSATPVPSPVPTAPPGGGNSKCKKGTCPSNRIALPGRYCNVRNGSNQTFLFALKVAHVSCKVAEALVDAAKDQSGKKKRYRLRPSDAICVAQRSVGTGMEYHCELGRKRIFYFGYGSLTLRRQVWTNLWPRGS